MRSLQHRDYRNPPGIDELEKLNRFTTLPVLLDLLKRRKLVLLDPKSWEDRNDSGVMREYQRRRRLRVFAMCFTWSDETIHQWKAFADGSSGCCIEFDAQRLIERFRAIDKMRFRCVKYLTLDELPDDGIPVRDMPFIKRWPYRCEDEFRVIWEGKSENGFFEFPIDLTLIRKVTLNQRLPEQVFGTIREHLRDVFEHPSKRISHSTLFRNKRWLKKFKAR